MHCSHYKLHCNMERASQLHNNVFNRNVFSAFNLTPLNLRGAGCLNRRPRHGSPAEQSLLGGGGVTVLLKGRTANVYALPALGIRTSDMFTVHSTLHKHCLRGCCALWTFRLNPHNTRSHKDLKNRSTNSVVLMGRRE